MTKSDLALKIRTKYEGSYDDKNDDELVDAWVKKYPVYQQYLDEESEPVEEETPERPQIEDVTEMALRGLEKFGPGGTVIGEGLGKNLKGLGKLAKGDVEGYKQAAAEVPGPKEAIGDIGRIGTSVASAVLPSPTGFAKTIGQFGGLGAAGAGSYALSQGQDAKTAFSNFLKGGVLGGVFGAGAYGLGKGLESLGRKAMLTEIKPRSIDLEDGFKLENVQKYKLGYSLKEIAQNADKQLDDFQTQLANEVADSSSVADLNTVIGKTERRILGDKARHFGLSPNIEKAVAGLRNEVDDFTGGEGLVSIPEAQTLKRSAGHLGAWLYGTPDPDAGAREKVYNIFYNELKKEIEDHLPAGIARSLNQKMTDLIPIINAVARRIPIAERNSAISLPEVVSLTGAVFDPSALGITGLRLMTTMGALGGRLQPFGQAAQKVLPAIRSGSSQAIPNLSQEGLPVGE